MVPDVHLCQKWHGTSCPPMSKMAWYQLSMVPVVHGTSCPWYQLSGSHLQYWAYKVKGKAGLQLMFTVDNCFCVIVTLATHLQQLE